MLQQIPQIQTQSSVSSGSARMHWLDACRVFAALGVVLIHISASPDGQLFPDALASERVGPAIVRITGELSGSELFFLFSMFLIAFKIDRRHVSYLDLIREQAKRLLIPFVAWTVFYAFFRLFKAESFGYQAAIMEQIVQWQSWIGYLLLGSAQYHLHYLPTMFFLVLLYPALQAAIRYPVVGLSIIGTLQVMDYVQCWLWGHVTDPLYRDYLVRMVKIICYSGYGFAGFAVFGIWKRKLSLDESKLLLWLSLLLLAVAYMAKLVYAADAVAAAQWPVRTGAGFYAHFLSPVLMLTVFLGSQHQKWSPLYTSIAKYTFGIYLIHPIFIDCFDLLQHAMGWSTAPIVAVILKLIMVAPLAFATTYLLAKFRQTAWLVGLGPVPFFG
ncbi:acyltransferase [Burkholderia sp. Bp8963]|uniref:acyltransferase n=1 Tax=Burkholderia sp. Bp8963 TaxID=2184547 RepID=UPI000F59818A|nr:acyltransferase [Burkholderia sp. Bp8963]RQS72017.1 acyltransferase [Burkholderia sp. Bp8963]